PAAAQPSEAVPARPAPRPMGDQRTPAKRASDKLKDGLVFAALGAGLVILTCVGIGFLVGHDFPGVKLVGFLSLCLLALGLFGFVLGVFWTVQGILWSVKARRDR
ncbi:hypothetical protein ACFQ0D_26830, partial [Micromonospora zhanjiangensis]